MSSMNHHWLRRLMSGKPHFIIGGVDDPYLLRWFLIPRNHILNVYLHKFLRSDDDRALHDHPWWFVSIMLRGRYLEWLPDSHSLIPKLHSTTELTMMLILLKWLLRLPDRWLYRIQSKMQIHAFWNQ